MDGLLDLAFASRGKHNYPFHDSSMLVNGPVAGSRFIIFIASVCAFDWTPGIPTVVSEDGYPLG